MTEALARDLWRRYEAVHIVTYFHPKAKEAFEAVGLRGFWRGYFAGRAAPLGAVGPAPVIASFFSFAPSMVQRALPDVWNRATPEQSLEARLDGAVAALLDMAGTPTAYQTRDLPELAELLERAADAVDCPGRVLAAANAVLPRPTAPLARVWHATTVLREHRGDGHVAALVAAGFDGCEALVLRASLDLNREMLQPARGWTDEEWDAAAARLVDRGWLSADGVVTAVGEATYVAVEAATDRVAARPWEALDAKEIRRLETLLHPWSASAMAVVPAMNPIGLAQKA